jgi:hypothetical protein
MTTKWKDYKFRILDSYRRVVFNSYDIKISSEETYNFLVQIAPECEYNCEKMFNKFVNTVEQKINKLGYTPFPFKRNFKCY